MKPPKTQRFRDHNTAILHFATNTPPPPPSSSSCRGWGTKTNRTHTRSTSDMATYNCAPLGHSLFRDMFHSDLEETRQNDQELFQTQRGIKIRVCVCTPPTPSPVLQRRHRSDGATCRIKTQAPHPQLLHLPVRHRRSDCRRILSQIHRCPARIPLGKPSQRLPSPL